MTASSSPEHTMPGAAVASDTASPARGPAGISSGYQPALDGVRAIAVTMVVCFHLSLAGGLNILGGGWLGVDVFFVLSGYLITSLLLTEHQRHGRIDLKNFYVRRFLRLAPLAIGLVLMLWLITSLGLSDKIGLTLDWKSGFAVLFYYSNWWFIAHPGSLGSLGHAWSLSIEEQFYFIWPWIVVGVFVVARRSTRTVLIGLTLGAVIAIGLTRRYIWLASTVPGTPGDDIIKASLSFFRNSLLRGDGLLYGCLLALLLHGVTVTPWLRRIIATAAIPALVIAVVTVGFTHYKTWQPWVPFIPAWGLSLFDLTVTVVVAWLVVAPHAPLARLLSLRPLTWIGRRAYGIYLLHPMVSDSLLTNTSLRRWPFELVVGSVTLIAAGLSFRYFESPFLRLKERFSSR